jgi:hypothetical protein
MHIIFLLYGYIDSEFRMQNLRGMVCPCFGLSLNKEIHFKMKCLLICFRAIKLSFVVFW